MTRHRPVEGRGRQRLRFAHAHVERHAIIGLPGFVGVGERQGTIVEGQRLRKCLRIVFQRLGIAQIFRLQHEKTRLGPASLAHQIHEFPDRRHRRLLQPGGVVSIGGLVEIEKPAVAGARERVGEFFPDRAIVRDKIEREGNRVVHEPFTNKNLQRVHGVDFPVAHRLALQFQSVETRALLGHHAAFFHIPKRLAVAHAHEMRAEIERPQRVQSRTRARKQPRGLHDLGRDDPARSFRRRALLRTTARPALGRTFLRLLAAKKH